METRLKKEGVSKSLREGRERKEQFSLPEVR
jgi:hypothetical protein